VRRLYTLLVGALALACLAMAVLSGTHAMEGGLRPVQTAVAGSQATAPARSGNRAAKPTSHRSKLAGASSGSPSG